MINDTIDDASLVPLRWLVVIVGSAVSCFGACLYLVFSTGALTTKVVIGQEVLSDRITAVEKYQEIGRAHYNDILQRIAIIETQNKEILEILRKK